jgi:hypothetical protein
MLFILDGTPVEVEGCRRTLAVRQGGPSASSTPQSGEPALACTAFVRISHQKSALLINLRLPKRPSAKNAAPITHPMVIPNDHSRSRTRTQYKGLNPKNKPTAQNAHRLNSIQPSVSSPLASARCLLRRRFINANDRAHSRRATERQHETEALSRRRVERDGYVSVRMSSYRSQYTTASAAGSTSTV